MGIELKLQLDECELNDSTLSPQFQCPASHGGDRRHEVVYTVEAETELYNRLWYGNVFS